MPWSRDGALTIRSGEGTVSQSLWIPQAWLHSRTHEAGSCPHVPFPRRSPFSLMRSPEHVVRSPLQSDSSPPNFRTFLHLPPVHADLGVAQAQKTEFVRTTKKTIIEIAVESGSYSSISSRCLTSSLPPRPLYDLYCPSGDNRRCYKKCGFLLTYSTYSGAFLIVTGRYPPLTVRTLRSAFKFVIRHVSTLEVEPVRRVLHDSRP